MSETINLNGTVWGVFAHRFAIETPDGRVLADIGPHAAQFLAIREGDRVTITGTRKPSEIKVETLAFADQQPVKIDWPPKQDKERFLDESAALGIVRVAGFVVLGPARRKPRHWEIAAGRNGQSFEIHVDMDGSIRKTKELSPSI